MVDFSMGTLRKIIRDHSRKSLLLFFTFRFFFEFHVFFVNMDELVDVLEVVGNLSKDVKVRIDVLDDLTPGIPVQTEGLLYDFVYFFALSESC